MVYLSEPIFYYYKGKTFGAAFSHLGEVHSMMCANCSMQNHFLVFDKEYMGIHYRLIHDNQRKSPCYINNGEVN